MMSKFSRGARTCAGGALVGLVNGLFGGGGGMIAVPVLLKRGLSPVKAHATAIAVILPVTIVSGIVYLFGGLAPLNILLPTSLGVVLGGYIGAKLLGVLNERAISLIFALLMLLSGGRMLFS